MQKSHEYEDSYSLRSGKRYKVDHGDHFEHRRSHSGKPRLNSPRNPRKESGFIPPTPQKSFVNPPMTSQTFPRGQNPPPV